MSNTTILEEIYLLAKEEFGKEDHDAQVVELLGQYLELSPQHEFRPEHHYGWTLFGAALSGIGRAKEALPVLMQAFEYAPEESKGHVASRIARLLEEYASPRQAKKWHKVATDCCSPREGWAWVFRGANLAVLCEFKNAIRCYEKAIEINASCDIDGAWLNMGYCYRALREYDNAKLCFQQALAVSTKNKEARTALRALKSMPATLKRLEKILNN
jgi:tetratricopeptide (TPR) repeat protein